MNERQLALEEAIEAIEKLIDSNVRMKTQVESSGNQRAMDIAQGAELGLTSALKTIQAIKK